MVENKAISCSRQPTEDEKAFLRAEWAAAHRGFPTEEQMADSVLNLSPLRPEIDGGVK